MTVVTIIVGLLIFSIIVAIHELGHFVAAKLCGIRVNEFAIGMGPAFFKRQKGETLYALRIFPIGGFCAFEGEDSDSSDPRAFGNKKFWQKIIVLVAGPLMNLVLGFIILLFMVSFGGKITSTTVAGFYDNAPSRASGLEIGDKITRVNGMKIFVDGDIMYQFMNSPNGIFTMEVERGDEKVQLPKVTFDMKAGTESAKQAIVIDFFVKGIDKNPITVLEYSAKKTVYYSRLICFSFIDLIQGKYGLNELSGPVGIVTAIGSVMEQSVNWKETLDMVLNMSVMISINVGIFNLIPLPALDGGRIVLRLIEGATKKKFKPETEGAIHFVGLALLLILMVVVTFNDVSKLFVR